jgi:hypothetical protein
MDAPLVTVLAWSVRQTQELAVGILAISGAIVGGYVVSCLVPEAHYPRAFGVIAANVILAGLAWLGITAVADADLLMSFLFLSAFSVAMIHLWKSD